MSLPRGLAPSLRAPLQSGKTRMKKLPKRSQNEKYRLKYLRLRKAAKATVFENAAICDEIARLEEKFLKAKEERRSSPTGLASMMRVPSTLWVTAVLECMPA
ncbi:transforming growth factor beta regulator 1 [Rhinolophus ferrumequinum]|uniref:Transforming growth factor beta regulator 1 n=1 Tax=Rhinolophus ferrumequinum TaxID=59479 RepID=A0A7J7RR61_RHIFE|nr:transforming growth factor beta regulator 1 [Rhinolophus ferrumequinum]